MVIKPDATKAFQILIANPKVVTNLSKASDNQMLKWFLLLKFKKKISYTGNTFYLNYIYFFRDKLNKSTCSFAVQKKIMNPWQEILEKNFCLYVTWLILINIWCKLILTYKNHTRNLFFRNCQTMKASFIIVFQKDHLLKKYIDSQG